MAYMNIYEGQVQCFVITCAFTTVIQLKLIIIKEPSPVFYTLYAVKINSWLSFHVCL